MCELITIAERSTIFDNNNVAHHRFPPSLLMNCGAVVVVVVVVISTVSPEKHTVPKQSDVSSDIVLHAEDNKGLDEKHLYPEPHSLHTSAVVVVVVVVVAASKLAPSEHTVPVQSDVLSSIWLHLENILYQDAS